MTDYYVLDNHHRAAPRHHESLAALLDPATRERLRQLHPLAGARCLEVGAGHGSLARWLADQVGEAGQVTAADLAPQYLGGHPRLTPVACDLTGTDWPAELAGPYDVVVARMVLSHLPPRQEILRRLVARLAPGGVMLVEDWQPHPQPVVTAPDPAAGALYGRYQSAVRSVFAAGGTSMQWAPAAYAQLREVGLREVATRVHTEYWPGGSPGTRLIQAVVHQLWEALLDQGLAAAELRDLLALLDDPRLTLHGHLLYSTSGVRAAG